MVDGMAVFADRGDAGRQLALHLGRWRSDDTTVLGIPRGGVVVAAAVARALDAPLGVAVVRKLGSPSNEELAIGAIADGVRLVDAAMVRAEGVTAQQLDAVEQRELVELDRRRELFGATSVEVADRVVLVVDDGIATGATMTAACRAVRASGARRVVVAVPIAPRAWRPDETVDEYVCPHRERHLRAVGLFYDDFTQTTDAEVARLLSYDPRASA